MTDDPDFQRRKTDLKRLQNEDDRRFEQRVSASIFVEVSGFDKRGRFFTEHTATTDVSIHGCCFHLRQDIALDALLAIQPVVPSAGSSGEPVLFQIAWMEPIERGAVVGASRLHGETSWCVAFPVAEEKGSAKA
jgi:hypothetical protein